LNADEASPCHLRFLDGGGALGALIRHRDWSLTPLGSAETWPQSLRSALSICLHSSFPTAIYWGAELRLLYNDAWAPVPADRHPEALGRPAAEVWADIWAVVGPQFERVLATGEGFSTFDQMLPMRRGGQVQETYWNYSFTPIRGEDGSVAGVFNQGHETTDRVLAERQKSAETERLRRMFDQAPGFMAMLRGPEHVFDLANAAYMQLVGHRAVLGKTVRQALPEIAGQGFFELLDNVLASGQPFVGRAMPVDLQRLPGGATERRFVDLVYQPVTDALGLVSGIFVEGSDVTERVVAEKDLRVSEERLKLLDRLGEATARAFAPREIMATTAALLGNHLSVTRCAYADVDANNDSFTIRDDWTDGAPSSAGEYSLELFGSRAAADMRSGRTLVVRDVEAELPADDGGRMFSAIGIKAVICCPLVKQGRLVAMMAVHQSSPRHWTDAEVALLETVVERSWAHIERVRDEAALRDSEERLRLIVEGARNYAIFTTDREGRIDAWLPGAENVFGWRADEVVGRPASIIFTPEDREAGEAEKELETAQRQGTAPDVRWHLRKDGARVFIDGSVVALRRREEEVRGFLKVGQDVTARRAAEEAQALLAREVDHRAKNALAVVQTMLRLTRADDVPSFARTVERRVAALARAQTLLAEGRWNGAALHQMLQGELAPFLAGQRAELDGPPLVLPPGTAQPLAMAVHELATNAAKHGALSVPAGRVAVSWHLEEGVAGVLRLRWVETGGPPVSGPPTRRGFGSRVLEGTVRGQLGGAVSLAWARTGLVCELEIPLAGRPAAAAGVTDVSMAAAE
jgi:PAS domain S-box-containing protein